LTGLYSTGQTNSVKYPYAQIKNNSLEFVFSSPQEKSLREINEVKKNAYKYIDQLKTQVFRRDSIIFELNQINSLYVKSELENKKQEKLLTDKYRTLNQETVKLQDSNNQLLIENKDLESSKNKWKNRFTGLSAIVGIAVTFLILN
jgi:FtsZ-binding cell division protein ZapB